MTTPIRNVAIVGASGVIGPHILNALHANPAFTTITAITRASSRATFPHETRVVRVPDDYPHEAMVAAFRGQDAVVLSLGVAGDHKHEALVAASVEAGVRRLVPSLFGGNEKARDRFPLARRQGEILDDLRRWADKVQGGEWSWSGVQNGLFYDFAIETGFLGIDVKSRKATIWDSGDTRFSTTTCARVGQAVVQALLHPEETRNRCVYVSSFQVTTNEILASVKKAAGASEWHVEHVEADAMFKKGTELWDKGDIQGMMIMALAETLTKNTGQDYETEGILDNKLLGFEAEDLDEITAKVIEKM